MSTLLLYVLAAGSAALAACGDDAPAGIDAGLDAGPDGSIDAAPPPIDAGADAGADAGPHDPLAEFLCEPIAACGGELVGRWTFASLCFDPTELDVGLYVEEDCPGQEVELERSISGFLDIRDGGEYQIMVDMQYDYTVTTPASCLPAYLESCAGLAREGMEVACTGDLTRSCTCAGIEREVHAESGTWVATGSKLVFDDSGDGLDFCQDGDTLTLQFAPEPGEPPVSVFTLTR